MKRKTFNLERMTRLTNFLGSRRFFLIILGVFVFQASWIALTARYPQAFDEQFHFGIIKQYANHLSPFWNGQPLDVQQFGAITRDPSYLYQYLLSFPYRIVRLFTNSETVQIVLLRFINVAILASAIVVFRKVLCRVGASSAMRNVVLAFFVITPVVPLLAGQINYDNLFILMTALSCLVYLDFRQTIRADKRWAWDKLTLLVILCLVGCLVKYAYMPVAAGFSVAAYFDWRFARHHSKSNLGSLSKLKINKQVLLYGFFLLISLGLVSERYGVNMVKYHTPIPECNQVLSIAECQGYAPWARNYMFAGWDIHPTLGQLASYPWTWVHRALGEMVFTITSNFNAKGTVDYHAAEQLVIPNVLSWTVFVGGVLLCIRYGRYLWGYRELRVLLGIAALYVLALFTQNALDFLHLGLPVAIHGRYLLPVLPLLYLAIALAVARFVQAVTKNPLEQTRIKSLLTIVVLTVFLIEGGGFVTLIIRSDASWFWPQHRSAQLVNQYAQDALKPIVLDY